MQARFSLKLRSTVEAIVDGDGAVCFLVDGTTADYVLESDDARARNLTALLEAGQPSLDALAAAMNGAGTPASAAELSATVDELAALGFLEDHPEAAAGLLDAEERERYDRQLAYFGAMRPGESAVLQRALLDATVTIVGCGGLGSWAAAALACSGIGRLVLIDDDRIDLSNLNRQILYRRSDVGRLKVEVAAEALGAFNPGLGIATHASRIASPADAAHAITGSDFVVDTADWPPYDLERWLDAACLAAGTPRICAAQYPPWIRIGPTYAPGRTGCVACVDRAARRDFPLYDAVVAQRRARPGGGAATLGPASGIIGSLIAMEVVHALTGIADPASLGSAIVIDLRDLSITREALPRDPTCERCGTSVSLDP
jgi:bacteriocin biosynthesis cyclodehydratase domain-containing protein